VVDDDVGLRFGIDLGQVPALRGVVAIAEEPPGGGRSAESGRVALDEATFVVRVDDLGADATPADGGLRVRRVRPGGLADRLGLVDGDLLVTLAQAPVASLDDLVTVLRVLLATEVPPTAEWIRAGELVSSAVSS
jgi:S1-C subfamily serine protease